MLNHLLRLMFGFCMVLGCWAAGNWLTVTLHLPLPAPVTGLLLLFAAFTAVPRLADLTSPAADLMLRFLPLFLYPFAAGFLDLPAISLSAQLRLALVILLSLVGAMVVAVVLFQKLRRHDP